MKPNLKTGRLVCAATALVALVWVDAHSLHAQEIGPAPTNPLDNSRSTGAASRAPASSIPTAAPVVAPNATTGSVLPAATLAGRVDTRLTVNAVGGDALADRLPESLRPVAKGLDAQGSAKLAVKNHPTVLASKALAKAAEAMASENGRRLIPTLTFTARYTRLSSYTQGSIAFFNPNRCFTDFANCQTDPNAFYDNRILQPAFLNQFLGRATVLVPLSDIAFRLRSFSNASEQQSRASKFDLEAAKHQAALMGREAFYEYLRALGQVGVAEQSLKSAQKQLQDIKHGFEQGTATKADLMRAEATGAEFQRVVLLTRYALELTEVQLRQRLGLKPDHSVKSSEDLVQLPVIPDKVELLLEQAYAQRTELKSLDAQVAAMSDNISGTRAGMYPSLSAVGNYDYANPNTRYFPQTQTFRGTWDATLQLAWSPTDAHIVSATVDKLKAQRMQIEAQRLTTKQNVELDVRGQWNQTQVAKQRVVATRSALLAAEEAARVQREKLAVGAATETDVAVSQTQLMQARMDLVNAYVDIKLAAARLKRSLGEGI